MPCWPDLWRRMSEFQWPALVLVFIVLLIWAPAVRWGWLRIALRVLGGTAALCVLAVVGIGTALNGNTKPQYRTVYSPNGSHRATLMYEAGFLGRDISSIEITKRGSCQRFTAYQHDGPADLQGETMVWLDESHLQIKYRSDPGRHQRCQTRVADVTITCTPITAGDE